MDQLRRTRVRWLLAASILLPMAFATGGCGYFHGPDHTVFDTAQSARLAIRQGEFSKAETLVNQVLAHSHLGRWHFAPFAAFIGYVSAPSGTKFGDELNAWVAAKPEDPIPRLIRANYRYNLGWWIRGNDFDDAVDPAHAARFKRDHALAEQDIATAIRLARSNPYARFLQLLIARDSESSAAQETTFQQAIAKFPSYYPLYWVRLSSLQPKWGGSVDAMKAFVNRYAGAAPADSTLRMLYLNLYTDLLTAAAEYCESSGDLTQSQCVDLTMGQIAGNQITKAAEGAVRTFAKPDDVNALGEIEANLESMVRTCGSRRQAMHFLQLAAAALHSDTQLTADDAQHNIYIIDRVASLFWYRNGTYANALTLSQRAITDLANTRFPNAAHANAVEAGIDHDLMATYKQLGDNPQVVKYGERAARLLGGYGAAPYYDRMACYAQFLIKHYAEAVKTCTAIIDASDDAETREDRAEIYEKTHQDKLAIADYQIVADSGAPMKFRTFSAIAIGVIYAKEKQDQRALDSMNGYSNLFVPGKVSRDSLAVYFNNRCYYKMKLGHPRAALDDCNTSLRYGNLPDALAKQQKLMHQLGKF